MNDKMKQVLSWLVLAVLVGTIIGPEITVNPYDLIGLWLGVMVLVYVITNYSYNRKM